MKKITIGVVDDNKDFCDVVTEHLKKQSNMEISFVAHDGREAMEVLNRGNCPDVLVLDLIMPHLDGFGVLEGLNNLELSKYPRVIMTSGSRTGFYDPKGHASGRAVLSCQAGQYEHADQTDQSAAGP